MVPYTADLLDVLRLPKIPLSAPSYLHFVMNFAKNIDPNKWKLLQIKLGLGVSILNESNNMNLFIADKFIFDPLGGDIIIS